MCFRQLRQGLFRIRFARSLSGVNSGDIKEIVPPAEMEVVMFAPEKQVREERIRNLKDKLAAVSYTHLDVYKRQGSDRSFNRENQRAYRAS